MQELLSYRLSDLLLFSEQSYLRQFELYHHWLYPAQWMVYLYGAVLIFSAFRKDHNMTRALLLISAFLWLLCAYGYLWRFYSAINWIAEYFIVAFIVQALLILWAGYLANSPDKKLTSGVSYRLGLMLWVVTLVAQPGFEFYSGRAWNQLSTFAITPDSLSFVAIAFMLILRLPRLLFLPSALWLLFSVLTYLAMESLMVLFPAFALSIYLVSFIQPVAEKR